MGFIDYMNQRVRKASIFDVKSAQGAAMFLALIIAKLVPGIMTISIWWFVGLLILCVIRPVYVFWFK